MILTDKDLKKQFPFGMSAVEEDSEDTIPMRGIVRPHPDNPDWFDLWIADGANTVFEREVEPASEIDGGVGYLTQHNGKTYRLVPIPEANKVVL